MGLGLIFGGDVTKQWTASATAASGNAAPHQLGEVAITRAADGIGYNYWVFVENPSGGTAIDQYSVVEWAAAGGNSVATATAAIHHPNRLAGIAQLAMAVDTRGWVQTWGRGKGINDAAVALALGDSLITSGADAGDVNESTLGTDDYATIGVCREVVSTAVSFAMDITISK